VTLANLDRLHHPAVAVVAIAATLAITVAASLALRGSDWQRALRPGLVGAEAAVAALVVAADGWVQQGRLTGQTLAGSWPIAAILVAALAAGLAGGLGVAVLLSAARAVAVVISGTSPGQGGRQALAVISTAVSWIVFGAVTGVIIRLVRRTQRQLADAEVRERIARDLHDGVLQTLAMIERRSPAPDIAQLARDQERDLRAYLFGDYHEQGTLAAQLRTTAARFEKAWPSTAVTVTVSDDLPTLTDERVEAVSGAVAEALTNAAKHGQAGHTVVFADVDERSGGGVFVSVKDDGKGFEPATVAEGMGMARSIRGRVQRVGGSVEFASTPGEGTEVRITIPSLDSARSWRRSPR
jgi:signal transduction histidine kinase